MHPSNFLIHRRGSLCFNLARLHQKNHDISSAINAAEDAREFFERKKSYDPYLPYNYVEFLNLEIWYLSKIPSESEKPRIMVKIEELLHEATSSIAGNQEIIQKISLEFRGKNKDNRNEAYKRKLISEIEVNSQTPPYNLLLLYYYYENAEEFEKSGALVPRLEQYKHLDTVAINLFKIYSKSLFEVNNRIEQKFSKTRIK